MSDGEANRLRSDGLSESQRTCLRLVSAGYTSKEIARATGLTPLTVDQYMSKAASALGVTTRREAARILTEAEKGVFSPSEVRPQVIAELFDIDAQAALPDRSVYAHLRDIIRLPPVGGVRHTLGIRERAAVVFRVALASIVAFSSLALVLRGAILLLDN